MEANELRSEVVVVVDDDPKALKEKATALFDIGFTNVYQFMCPDKVRRKYDEMPVIDLLITDMSMSPLTGMELIEKLREEKRYQGRVLLVSKGDKPQNYHGAFMRKPVFIPEYVATLKGFVLDLLGRQ